MKGELRPIGDVLLLPDNPRHGDIGAISQSLARFGQQKPIVVNSDGIILAGNHTYQAARMLGWSEIWVVESELEGSDQTGFALADNRLSDLATYDHDVLLAQLQELDDLDGTGYDLEDMDDLNLEVNGPGFSGDDRFTPSWLFDIMELEFDIDLAAPIGGAPTVPAARWFTKEDDALTQDWSGLFAWCNPPFSLGMAFGRKWVDHQMEGVWLGPVSSNTTYVPDLMKAADLVWMSSKQLEFSNPLEVVGGIGIQTYLAAFGPRASEGLRRLSDARDGVLLTSVT